MGEVPREEAGGEEKEAEDDGGVQEPGGSRGFQRGGSARRSTAGFHSQNRKPQFQVILKALIEQKHGMGKS